MFKKARLKLTLWYLLIITFISISFSLVLFSFLSHEIDRFSGLQRIRVEKRLQTRFPDEVIRKFPPAPEPFDPDIISETKGRIIFTLTAINWVIIFISGALGYFLSGKTLAPIKEMVDNQDRFISDASHELRTPLASLKTSIEVGLRDKKLSLTSAKKLMAENLEDIDNLAKLATSLLDITSSNNYNSNLVLQEVNTTDLFTSSIRSLLSVANSKNIKVIKKIIKTNLKVDREKIIQLITIVLDNAIKFSQPKSKVKILTKKDNVYYFVSVIDQGIGISETDKTKIFDRFYKVSNSRSRVSNNGFGLGLSIASSIVNQHKGKIWIESEVNKGTTVHIKLPLSQNIQKDSANTHKINYQ